MISIAIHGCSGHMGQVVSRLAAAAEDITAACGFDVRQPASDPGFPVYTNFEGCTVPFDVVIDFSTAAAVDDLLDACVAFGKPLVLCTTGLSDAQKAKVAEASTKIPVFFSANMSLGINLLTVLARKACRILSDAGFDIEIEERHHRRKLDAPSGTALMLGEAMVRELGEEYYMDMGRMDRRAARDPHAIGMSAVRGGTIVGEHTILFAGQDEMVELKHTALSRDVFAAGAISAARFLIGRSAGLYDMNQLVETML